MELSEDISRRIEESPNRDTIRDVVSRLQSDRVVITRDIIAAIEATIAMPQGVTE